MQPSGDSAIQTVLEAGEYTLTVSALPNHLGQWKLNIVDPTGGITTTIPKSDAAWFVDNPGVMTRQAGGHGRGTESATSAEPFLLLKVNCKKTTPAAAALRAPDTTTEGLMIWAAELGPDAPQTASAAPSQTTAADEPPVDSTTSPMPLPAEACQ